MSVLFIKVIFTEGSFLWWMVVFMYELVSVYITTHNRKELLMRAINSVQSQDYKNIELIIVDDASSDGTKEMMSEYVNNHKNVKYFRTEKSRGACYNRNVAIENAEGYYITGLDDDDYFEPERVSQLVSHFDENKYSCVTSAIVAFDHNGFKKAFHRREKIITLNALLHLNHIGNQVLTTKKRLIEVGGFDVDFLACQDYDLWVRLVSKFGPCKRIAYQSYNMYVGDSHLRISTSANKEIGHKQFLEKHKNLMSRSAIRAFNYATKMQLGKEIKFFDFFSLISLPVIHIQLYQLLRKILCIK